MPAFVLMLIKTLGSQVLLALINEVMNELKERPDNTVVKDADKVIDIIKNNTADTAEEFVKETTENLVGAVFDRIKNG